MFFILMIVVVVLALTLAALAGYLFIVQGSSNNKSEAIASTEPKVKEIPKEEDLVKIPLYDGKRYFNLKNEDPQKIAMMQVNVILKCHKTLKEKENKKVVVENLITEAYSDEIQELVVRFFLTKTIDDVKNVEIMDKAKAELLKEINALLNEGAKKPEEIVYKVIFSEWLFQ